jgi:hypothetical protein
MKEKIQKYKINGEVYTWTCKDNNRNYPGWNFMIDKNGVENLIELLDLMKKCEWSSKKTIRIENPTDSQLRIPNNLNGKAKWKTKDKLILNCRKTEPENYWLIKETDKELEFRFGGQKLIDLQNAISRIGKGNGDFAISDNNEENILYFW